MADQAAWLSETSGRIRQAAADGRVLCIRGGGSKDFYGNAPTGERIETASWRGVIEYQPRELTLTARAGTPLSELEHLLAGHRQMLPFEPPGFGTQATLGGCIAAGLAGPRRPYAGSVRDAVLGVHLLDGRGRQLRFGGQVIKNVAGYDVSRMLAGSLGTLGLLLEVVLKVLPQPECERTLILPSSQGEAIRTMNRWAAQPLPLSATAWRAGCLHVRLSGSQSAVAAAAEKLGGEQMVDGEAFWHALKEQQLEEFSGRPLWRVSVPPTAPPLELNDRPLIEWGGGIRWYGGEHAAAEVHASAAQSGGHATLFRREDTAQQAFAPMPPPLAALHQRVRRALDPQGVFSTGRM